MNACDFELSATPHYAKDDYEDVNAEFFNDILRTKTWSSLPAGWHNPKSVAAETFPLQQASFADGLQYALDEGFALGDLKEVILIVLGRWEARALAWEELTICPSVSTANLVVLSALKARGYQHICFESPAYFATPVQAEMLGFEIRRVSGTRANDFEIPASSFIESFSGTRKALWLTQPRFGLGTNQDLSALRELASRLSPDDVLVFDEAAEQMFPSVLSTLGPTSCAVLRTRGLMKGIGMNGMRLAAIFHPNDWRADMELMLEPCGASLDRFSLRNFATFADSPSLLPSLLETANRQASRLRKEAELITLGTWAKPTSLVNGYIGSVMLDLRGLPGDYASRRRAFLHYCRERRMPVVMRASIGFPHDDTWEAVRLNYFTPDENVSRSAETLVSAYEYLSERLAR